VAFATQEDIGNRAAQHCGARRFTSFTDATRQAAEISFAYDKLRVAELRRSVWRFATRRAVLRALTSTSSRFVPPLYSNVTLYHAGQIVRDTTGIYWIAGQETAAQTPGVPVTGFPAPWAQYFGPVVGDAWVAGTYYAGDVVYVSTTFYVCTANGNTTNPASPGITVGWMVQPASSATLAIPMLSPAGPGITVGKVARNIFPLPNGFLRLAAPDPKFASTSVFATTGAIKSQDWMLENNVLISAYAGPIYPFRFVADLSDVASMDPLFCEALGARIGYEVCETLTQSAEKKKDIGAAYQKFVNEARMVNQIEIGSTEPAEDEMQPAQATTQAPQGANAG
jgi:hypothetical protein